MSVEDKIKAAKAAYAREYRKRNPEKVKAAQERYWLKRLEKERGENNAKED